MDVVLLFLYLFSPFLRFSVSPFSPFSFLSQAAYSGALHNCHELIFACMWSGNYKVGAEALNRLKILCKTSGVERMPTRIEPFGLAQYHFDIRFGRWENILSRPILPEMNELEQTGQVSGRAFYATTHAHQCYARGVAFAAMGNVDQAKVELVNLVDARKSPLLIDDGALSLRRMHNVPEQRKLAIAEMVLIGEIQYREGLYAESFETLSRGVELDDNLPFDEPWGWMVPVRHALAALLYERGRTSEDASMLRRARDVCRDDLRMHPNNVWSLVCLRDCLVEMDKCGEEDKVGIKVKEELVSVLALIDAESKRTGVAPPGASCACAVKSWKSPMVVIGREMEETKMEAGGCCTGSNGM